MIPRDRRRELREILGEALHFDAPLARCTSLRVGGAVDALATPGTRAQLAALLRWCARRRVPHAVLGAGFNTLAGDAGLAGVAIQLAGLRRLEERPGARVRAEAGVSHSQLTNFCARRGLAGLEFGAGIPGTVGGWVAMNAGVPEREVKDALCEIEVMSPTGCRVSHLPREALRFRYRSLRGLAPGSIVLSALFEVRVATPAAVRAEVARMLARRAGTQPLNVPSCGSVFKNPPGDFAGRLIESAGLKGRRIGGAQISPVHANFIANLGDATAADVLALIDAARTAVWRESRRRLEPEVRVLGGPPREETRCDVTP